MRRVRAGGLNERPHIRTSPEGTASAVLDGDNGMGHLVMHRATELAIKKALAHGIGWSWCLEKQPCRPCCALRRARRRARPRRYYFAVGSANHMAPWGSIDALLSSNPIALRCRAGARSPFCSTWQPRCKVKLAAQGGLAIPEVWMIDGQGQPLAGSTRAREGTLLPIGGYKGDGLSLMIACRRGPSTARPWAAGSSTSTPTKPPSPTTGRTIAELDPKASCNPEVFANEVDRLIDELHVANRLPSVDRIRVPGEGRHEICCAARRMAFRCRRAVHCPKQAGRRSRRAEAGPDSKETRP